MRVWLYALVGAVGGALVTGLHLYFDHQEARDRDRELYKLAVACNSVFFDIDGGWLQREPKDGASIEAIERMRTACGSDILRVNNPD